MRARLMPALSVLGAVVAVLLVAPAPAQADGRVTVANESGDARIDPTYATTLTVRGSGFQSVRGGHGGIYVFFGTVKPGWRPSQGGATGADYFYVPDSESRANQGFQRFVAFPGSDTASSANGGTMSAGGGWSTSVVVPGAVFEAQDRSGGSRTVDCRTVTCGVITVGAHGVVNARNETFTPVSVGDLYADQPGDSPSATPSADAPSAPGASAPGAPAPAPTTTGTAPRGPPALEVDRTAAQAGHVLAFTATGLPAGSQVSAVLDDGVAGAGPFLVGVDGAVGGVVTLPQDIEVGTHELRLFGVEEPPSVRFAVAADEQPTPVASGSATEDRLGVLVLAGSALVLLVVVARLLLLRRGARRAA
ncbi:hypothetical protein [Nocardioides sp. 503]|uniref:hypothetical protein n=1 Tax=Nocardioides sp. 503 TaxID=2508326 RepID=UPI00107020AF|nr:hypothetical protein [Nocardioides sp. 503]